MSGDNQTEVADSQPRFVDSPDVAVLIRDSLNPYVAVGSTLIAILGILGGWPGDNLTLAIVVFIIMGIASGVLGSYWKKAQGTPARLMLASAATFLPLTMILVILSGGLDSPMWLLFLVGSLTAAFSNSRVALPSLFLTCCAVISSMWVPTLFERGLLLEDAATVAMRMVALVAVWGMTHVAILAVARVVTESSDIERERARAVEEAHIVREQLRHGQKMEALGRLAGGIAHDFNNLLTVIMGISSGLREDFEDQDELTHELDEILAASERAAELTHQLLAFSRRDALSRSVVDLNEVVHRSELMLGRVIRDNIDFKVQLYEQPLLTLADRGELEQVIMNLVVNARDAMPNGGGLTITCSRRLLEENDPMLRAGMKPGNHVVLSVADNGIGMTQDVAARAFDPFFTTKGPGAGTGLGLATVYGIVSKHLGNIRIDTALGRGTTFLLVLRESDVGVTDEVEALPRLETPTKVDNVQVIVVEDSPMVRDVVVRTLLRANYRVSAYEDPTQLLADSKRLDTPFDLLITDVVMPKMSGVELVQTLREQSIYTPTLFISGYTGDSSLSSIKVSSDVLLMKPFSQSQLLAAVERLTSEPKVV